MDYNLQECFCQPGPPGSPGKDGKPGVGKAGPQGNKGDKGDKGDKGEIGRGIMGYDGQRGKRGYPGIQGRDGKPGEKGDPGTPAAFEQVFEAVNQIMSTAMSTSSEINWSPILVNIIQTIAEEIIKKPEILEQLRGKDGEKGEPGEKGEKGDTGDSPSIQLIQQTIEEILIKPEMIELLRGSKGDKGDPGIDGIMGLTGLDGGQGEPGRDAKIFHDMTQIMIKITNVNNVMPDAYSILNSNTTNIGGYVIISETNPNYEIQTLAVCTSNLRKGFNIKLSTNHSIGNLILASPGFEKGAMPIRAQSFFSDSVGLGFPDLATFEHHIESGCVLTLIVNWELDV